MLNPTNFSSFFEVLSGINFGGIAIITFFHKNLYSLIKRELRELGSKGHENYVEVEIFTYTYSIKTNASKLKQILNRFVIIPLVKLFGNIFIWVIQLSHKRISYIDSFRSVYAIYVPLFMYSGLFCLFMLIIPGFQAEAGTDNAAIRHYCNVLLLRITLSSIVFFVSSFLYIHFQRKKLLLSKPLWLMFISILFLILSFSISYIILHLINTDWLHLFVQESYMLLSSVIFILAFSPIVYMVWQFFFPMLGIYMVEIYNKIVAYNERKKIRKIVRI